MYIGHYYRISIKLESSRHIVEKYISNFMKIRLVGPRDVPREGRTDRHKETKSLVSQFSESA